MTECFVDIWHGSFSGHRARLPQLRAVLSEDERGKVEGMLREQAAMRAIVTRGLLRHTLAGYLHCDPSGLQFAVGEYGKPELAGRQLAFNLSHTEDSLLLAVSNLQTVGVDVETVKPRKSLREIARRCFSAREFAHWQRLPPAEQTRQFFRLWTIKEAFVKAVGRGIALGLERCEVDIDKPDAFSAVPEEYAPASAWQLSELELGDQLAAALVVPSACYELRRLAFEFAMGGGKHV